MSDQGGNESGLFSPVVLGFLIASVVAVFALSVVLSAIGGGEETPFQATLASPSAIGHKGFYTLLQRLGLPVSMSRINGVVTTGRRDLLIVDEPDPDLTSGSASTDAPNVLLILPKWSGQPDVLHEGWVSRVATLGLDVPSKILARVDKAAQVVREPPPAAWPRNIIGPKPAFDGEVQVITNSSLRPLIASGDKILLGEFTTLEKRIWVLSDPDPLENHGIATPANARLALAIVKQLRASNASIVFDETVHGAVAPERNPIQLLFQFPYVIVTGQVLVMLALLLLATTARFGGAEEPPPVFALGKVRLIDNIASLMDRAGHQAMILRRYISVKVAEAGRALHAPVGLDDNALATWLDKVGASRGVALKAGAILAASTTAKGGRSKLLPRLFNEARDIYRWNKDILDGSGRRQDNR